MQYCVLRTCSQGQHGILSGLTVEAACIIALYKYTITYLHNAYYYPRMRRRIAFACVCLSVCVSVCMFLCPAQALNFESFDLETSFLVGMYIFRISWPFSYVKVTGEKGLYVSCLGSKF